MPFQSRLLLCFAALSLLCATVAGAAASHALALDERSLRAFETAVDFQFFHGLGIIGVTLAGLRRVTGKLVWIAAWLLAAGTLLFCGSIYATTLGAPDAVGSAAPYGGVALMLGWLLFALSVVQEPR
jgi:uncharacterized membrane protein YgdD (TMEM256/DUF423 family)